LEESTIILDIHEFSNIRPYLSNFHEFVTLLWAQVGAGTNSFQITIRGKKKDIHHVMLQITTLKDGNVMKPLNLDTSEVAMEIERDITEIELQISAIMLKKIVGYN
jgi:hypothetical protein